ncbi:MAG: 3'-5' exonuclease, partial [Myxococcota bacterium]
AQLIRLEENYRSTQKILDAANAVISNNAARKGKSLFTRGQSGTPIRLRLFNTERDEGESLAEDVNAWLEEGRSASGVAVLYRTNAQSRPIEDALRRRRIPYKIYGGLRFYDRREIKDTLAFLRVLVNPRSDVDFLRIVNVPARGVGKTSVAKLSSYALEQNTSVFGAAGAVADGSFKLSGKAKSGISELVKILRGYQERLNDGEPGRIVEELLEDVGYLQMLRLEGTEESEGRLDNLAELVAGIDEYTEEDPDPSLVGYLESVALASDIDDLNDTEETVSLMTLHSAKGLEFPMVFMPGMEEGLFPHSRSVDDHAGLEEERRLAYVGITRAKDFVVMSAARVRHVFGEPRLCELSRFVGEVPEELLEVSAAPGAGALRRDDHYEADTEYNVLDDMPGYEKSMEPYRKPEPSVPEFTHSGLGGDSGGGDGGFPAGTRVYHATFGEGVVLSSEGAGRRQKLTVDFPSVGQKVIVARFVDKVVGDPVDDVPF